ncbi:fatty acid CoA ligase Acsl3-like [Chironomus tepperi]|uniref:fatty acid CoA ligase Acsl3-like n=1 Tax=Chironomus tepperi TaxID=113505 RepID=UPI00391F00D6
MSIGSVIVVGIIAVISFIYTLLTLPIYFLVQQPWKMRQRIKDVKAKPISSSSTAITYKNIRPHMELHKLLEKQGIDTLEKMIKYAVNQYKSKKCLGTRQILSEEDERQPDGKTFKKYRMGVYKWRTFDEVNTEASNFGKGLRELGVNPKDRIVIFAETRAEWMIAAHGLFKQNCTVCTIYATLGEDGIAFGVNETEVKFVITSHELLPKIRNILKDIPNVHTVVYFEDQLHPTDTTNFGNVRVVPYTEVVRAGANNRFDEHSPTRDDIAILMYTSGSTGVPKGVMLSHWNCISTVMSFSDGVKVIPGDMFLGLLPLAHVYELLAESISLCVGVPIGYSTALTLLDSSAKVMAGTMGDARALEPTVMTTVPLILDRVRKGVTDKMSKESAVKQALFNYCVNYKQRWTRRGYRTPIVDKIIFKKVAALMGGKMRAMISGGAPLSPDTHEFIRNSLCLDVLQGYGLTETTAGATLMEQLDLSLGRSGPPVTTSLIRIVNWEEGNYMVTKKPHPQGEVIVGGDNVSMGYFKRPAENAETFFVENGVRWMRTGDIAEIHEDGTVKIIDRKKDLVKLQHGEYISLGKVESELKTCLFVENICVYGDSTKTYCVAVIAPAEIGLKDLAATLGISGEMEQLCMNREVTNLALKKIQEHAAKSNLIKFEIPTKITLVPEPWTPESGLVTAAFKIKRKEIQAKYKAEYTKMYT